MDEATPRPAPGTPNTRCPECHGRHTNPFETCPSCNCLLCRGSGLVPLDPRASRDVLFKEETMARRCDVGACLELAEEVRPFESLLREKRTRAVCKDPDHKHRAEVEVRREGLEFSGSWTSLTPAIIPAPGR